MNFQDITHKIDSLEKFLDTDQYYDFMSYYLRNKPSLVKDLFEESNGDFCFLDDDAWWKCREIFRNHTRNRSLPDDLNTLFKFSEFYSYKTPDDSALISFTPTAKHGQQDRQLRMKPGRFLSKYCGYDNETVKDFVSRFNNCYLPPTLQIVETREEIIRIYENGPTSCMMGKCWSEERHPVTIYAGKHTKIGYIERDGRIVARAVLVHNDDIEKYGYVRIYGDTARMLKALKDTPYIKNVSLVDCEIPIQIYRNNEHRIKMPYIDGTSQLYYNGEVLKIFRNDDIANEAGFTKFQNASGTSGFTNHPDAHNCAYCGDAYFPRELPEEFQNVIMLNYYCPDCIGNQNFVKVYGHENAEGMEPCLILRDSLRHYVAAKQIIQLPKNQEYVYKAKVELFNYTYVQDELICKDDERIAIDHSYPEETLGLKTNMLKYLGNYYSRLTNELIDTGAYLNVKTGSLVSRRPAKYKSLHLYELVEHAKNLYRAPLYGNELVGAALSLHNVSINEMHQKAVNFLFTAYELYPTQKKEAA